MNNMPYPYYPPPPIPAKGGNGAMMFIVIISLFLIGGITYWFIQGQTKPSPPKPPVNPASDFYKNPNSDKSNLLPIVIDKNVSSKIMKNADGYWVGSLIGYVSSEIKDLGAIYITLPANGGTDPVGHCTITKDVDTLVNYENLYQAQIPFWAVCNFDKITIPENSKVEIQIQYKEAAPAPTAKSYAGSICTNNGCDCKDFPNGDCKQEGSISKCYDTKDLCITDLNNTKKLCVAPPIGSSDPNQDNQVCNCTVGNWSDWGPCVGSQGIFSQSRTRSVKNTTGDDSICTAKYPSTDTRTCNPSTFHITQGNLCLGIQNYYGESQFVDFTNNCSGTDNTFTHLPNGALSLASSNGTVCVHPSGGSVNPDNNTQLIYFNACSVDDNPDRIAFDFKDDGTIVHRTSGKCITPFEGTALNGTRSVLYQCNPGASNQKFMLTN